MNGLFSISKLKNTKTRLVTAENVYGEKGKGGMAKTDGTVQDEVTKIGQHSDIAMTAASELSQGFKVRPCISIKNREKIKILDVSGPSTITHIWITVDKRYLRGLVLRMFWDGEETPSVETPLGDFFCCGWSTPQNIMSIPINVNPTGGMNCFFPMPFRGSAKIEIENLTGEDVGGFFYAISLADGEISDDEAYFHARFNRVSPLEYKKDYVILDKICGKGHYVGTQMCWQQNNGGWWGEGEFKAFIDTDNEFPSYCGTATEDYFGGAWCFYDNFSAPFFGYRDLSAQGGRATNSVGNRHSMYRFHIADPICFEKDLKVTIQAIGWRSEGRYLPLKDDISSVAYWYQAEPHTVQKFYTKDELEII